MNESILGRCWQCSAELTAKDYGRETNCLGCGKPTRVCRNCRWFDPAKANACAEPMADPVLEKERANYCDYFEPTLDAGSGSGADSAEDLRKAAEDLFKF